MCNHCHLGSVQEMFCKQKGYLEEELDYRKQALDQAYMVSVPVSVTVETIRCFHGFWLEIR